MNSPVPVKVAAAGASESAARLAHVLLVRVASGGGRDAQVVRDLQPYVAGTSGEVWPLQAPRLIAALIAAGQITRQDDALLATPAGRTAASAFLGLRKALEQDWPAVRDGLLIARALGLQGAAAPRLKALGKVDSLSALIVESHWKLKIKGKASTTRIRQALALVALERAFGNQIKSELGAKSALSAKAARLLAGQLAKKPRDFRTDARLVTGLAMESVNAKRSDLGHLRAGILARFLDGALPALATAADAQPAPSPRTEHAAELAPVPVPIPAPVLQPVPRSAPVAPPRLHRPDPQAFARAVKAAAAATAEGWPGNRRSYISLVWVKIFERHPEWGITAIEFKAMLVETHRLGLIMLVNADLKDKARLATVEASAVSYKNTVWHYVRVEE